MMSYYSYSLCQLCSNAYFTWTIHYAQNSTQSVLFPSGIFVEQTLRVTRSQFYVSVIIMSVLMRIQINTITPMYLVPFIIRIYLPH